MLTVVKKNGSCSYAQRLPLTKTWLETINSLEAREGNMTGAVDHYGTLIVEISTRQEDKMRRAVDHKVGDKRSQSTVFLDR